MNIKVLLLSVLTFAATLPMAADIPVGSWRSHLSYRSVTAVEETPGKIFAIGDGHLFSYSKTDSIITKYSKTDGFSENSVTLIKYDWESGHLVIVYSNSNVDVVNSDGDIINIPDIMEKSLAVDKGVNKISFWNSNAYLSTNFGIVVLNLKKYEVKDTYVIGDDAQMKPVYSFTSDGDYFYALMDGVIKTAPVKGANLLDYKNWKSDVVKIPDEGKVYSDIEFYCGKLLLCENRGDILEYSEGEWKVLFSRTTDDKSYFHVSKDNMVVYCTTAVNIIKPSWYIQGPYAFGCADILFSGDTFYMAMLNESMASYQLFDGPLKKITVEGPALGSSQRIYYDNGRIVVAPGNAWLDRSKTPGAILFFENDKWTSYTAAETGAADISPDNYFYDVVSVAVDPVNPNHWFASTWGEGVYEFLDGKAVKLHNILNTDGVLKSHSAISDEALKLHYTRVDGLKYDAAGNLWALSSIGSSGVEVNVVGYMTPDGLWHEASGYSPAQTANLLRILLFHSSGQHWLMSCHSKPMVIVKDGKKKVSFYSYTDKDGNAFVPSFIYDMVEDKDGTVWVGTSDGPMLFQNTGNVFNSTYRITRVKIPRNDGSGLADYLLNGIAVNALAVDGGNRKWIGTETAGLYVVSADGLTTINHFTTDNSPLPSNDITSIAINSDNGSVFIGTADGIVEYRDGVTEPEKKLDEKNFVVFPNPVLPDYTGLITLTGLEENTVVKVVNASGYLVYQGTSTGGTFTWNGRNFNGDNVGGGVYFFHLMNTSENNSRSSAAKVLIIR